MWIRSISAKEIINQIKEAKQKGSTYHREIPVDNCWSINILYSPYNKNDLEGLEITVLMRYRQGNRAISRVWLHINGKAWNYWYRTQEKIEQIQRIDVYPIISKEDCIDMKVNRFQFARNVESRLEIIYKEYITEMILKQKSNKVCGNTRKVFEGL